MVTDGDQVEPPLDDDALTTAEQVRATVAAFTRRELQRCKDKESPPRPIAPVPIPEAHVEPSEEVERSPDDPEPGMRVPFGGCFDIHIPGSESDNTATDTDILAATMSAAEIVTGTVHATTVGTVPSTETLLGLIFERSGEEAAWAFQRLPEIIQHNLNGLGFESFRMEPRNPVASDATGICTTAVQDEQTVADSKEPDAEDESHSTIISFIPTVNSFNSLDDDVGDVAQAMQLRSGDNRAKIRVNPRRNVAAIDVTDTDAVDALLAVIDFVSLRVTAREPTPGARRSG
ncbi:hypothetical protein IscW_ISCW018660 [Ixodes scapularis]|uniref:Uncharacterized protein n=1 Tax=Ixodes scapularis TaxID=6945 RepID=B7PQL2_IXOSC|nr:hypothetical protein IscW_ISCW018660 [Ixodes scapularis]|eukprot:XP_002436052.1 hypothetical protein IscW_ISCW018660 [Ixodes scapularis]